MPSGNNYIFSNYSKVKKVIGNKEWINDWENRENGKSQNQKEMDKKLFKAAKGWKWDKVEKLLNDGATPDYVREDGRTAYYETLACAKSYNKERAKKVLEKFDQKWENEMEKNWTIYMAAEQYYYAALIIKTPFILGCQNFHTG